MRPLVSRRGLFAGALASLVSRFVPTGISGFAVGKGMELAFAPAGRALWGWSVVTAVDRGAGTITVEQVTPVALTADDYLFHRSEL